ncbi:hypothetical protein ES332_D04G218300v1 [Gossypium tomentosum]|uniref:Uncharacterized protein n=1 Tax=Gossypium tomentosum TaxID=34277 RepID=A0A5D2LFY8_GOSTO|nr:hypothetical protein ES332_D04G218300v1 [Gossypium tomentosum]
MTSLAVGIKPQYKSKQVPQFTLSLDKNSATKIQKRRSFFQQLILEHIDEELTKRRFTSRRSRETKCGIEQKQIEENPKTGLQSEKSEDAERDERRERNNEKRS